MTRLSLAAVAALGLLGSAGAAQATIITTATPSTTAPANGMMTTYTGVTTLTFDPGTSVPSQLTGGVVVNGTSQNQFAAPHGDTSNFFAVGGPPSYIGSATFKPGTTENYLGLYWGSIDAYNTITFSLGGSTVGSFTGAAFPPSNGNQTSSGTNEFVDFVFSTGGYDQVTFSTTTANLEFDNLAFGTVTPIISGTPVPEPASIALLGMGVIAMGGLVRRRA